MTILSTLDPRAPLVLDTRELGRRPGLQRRVVRVASAPADLGIEVLGVPEGSDIALEIRLESVMEGVLVTANASALLAGECARCLDDIQETLTVDLQELYVYPESEAEEDEASRMEGDLIDLEPALRDAVVLALPFSPLCRPDCPGLCPECGVHLADDPTHRHDASFDPRWSALRDLPEGRRADQSGS